MRDLWQANDVWDGDDAWGYRYTEDVGSIRPGMSPPAVDVFGRQRVAYTARKPYLGAPQEFAASRSEKPYLGSPESFIGFATAAVRHLKDTLTKESAFEKPYFDRDYPKMHLNLPYPDWPRGSKFNPGEVVPTKGELVTGSSCKYCIITCYGDRASEEADCPETYGWCHISVACTSDPQLGEANPGDVGWSIEGPALSVEEDSMDGINIYVDWDAVEADADGTKTAAFTATLTDGLGHVCTDEFEVECPGNPCDCGTAAEFLFDNDSTANTIARSSSITIYTTGGCSPYHWSVSGTGFSLDASTTSTNTNTLRADGSACGTAIVTVTDYCSTELTIRIRCVEGQWVWDHNIGQSGDTCTCSACSDGSLVVDDEGYGYVVCVDSTDSIEGRITGTCGDPCYEYSLCMGSWYQSEARTWCCANAALCSASVGKNCCNMYVDHPEYGTGYCGWFDGSCGGTQYRYYTTRLIRVYTWECA